MIVGHNDGDSGDRIGYATFCISYILMVLTCFPRRFPFQPTLVVHLDRSRSAVFFLVLAAVPVADELKAAVVVMVFMGF